MVKSSDNGAQKLFEHYREPFKHLGSLCSLSRKVRLSDCLCVQSFLSELSSKEEFVQSTALRG